jgi:hypothetical protein
VSQVAVVAYPSYQETLDLEMQDVLGVQKVQATQDVAWQGDWLDVMLAENFAHFASPFHYQSET